MVFKVKQFLACLFLCIGNLANSETVDRSFDSGSELRISKLLPNLVSQIAVEPAIPDNFVALSPNGIVDLYDWVYWGPKDVLEAYFKNPASLTTPVLRVKLSSNVCQTGPNSFSSEAELKKMEKSDPKGFASRKIKWGTYPVLAVRTLMSDKVVNMAWVGLNDPESGFTLMFNLVYPEKESHPNKNARELWTTFLGGTKQLSEPDFFKAHGQDMQPGYTLVTVADAKFKMIAEKRERDGKLQLVVIPSSDKSKFEFLHMQEGQLGSQWKYGEPLLKVKANFEINDGNFKSIISNHMSSVLIKTVPEFSHNIEQAKERSDLFIFQR